MAKLALINREAKRAATVAKYAAKRAALKAIINDATRSMEERLEARAKLQALPRDASPVRQRNRCALTVVKKHVRPNPHLGVAGGIVEKNMPIDQSNVMLVNPETGKGDRVGFKEVDGKKVRVFKSNGAVVGAKA